MIPEEWRFWMPDESVFGAEKEGSVIDWDQRRWFTVKGTTEFMPPEEEVEVDIVRRYIDNLAPSVRSITVDDEGLLVSVSSDAKDDGTLVAYYPRLCKCPSIEDCDTIQFSQLTELDRYGARTDLVSYLDESGTEKKVAFKYTITSQWQREIWEELHLVKSLPHHPNIVPFDRVVVDGEDARVIGFTTAFIPGDTVQHNTSRVFTLAHLKQLTALVDFLNLEHGITHQDIAARNLLIHPETNDLMLFDFDRAGRIDRGTCDPNRDDVKGVIFTLYEIVTGDEHFRSIPHERQDEQSVLKLKDWPVKCQLDADLASYRQNLEQWVHDRRKASQTKPVTAEIAPKIPEIPPPTPRIVNHDDDGNPVYLPVTVWRRPGAIEMGMHVVKWERPPQEKTYPGRGTKRKSPP